MRSIRTLAVAAAAIVAGAGALSGGLLHAAEYRPGETFQHNHFITANQCDLEIYKVTKHWSSSGGVIERAENWSGKGDDWKMTDYAANRPIGHFTYNTSYKLRKGRQVAARIAFQTKLGRVGQVTTTVIFYYRGACVGPGGKAQTSSTETSIVR